MRSRRTIRFILIAVLAFAVAPAGADDKGVRRDNARELTKAFLDAALNGRADQAAGYGQPGKAYSRPEKMKEFAELKLKWLRVDDVHADDKEAIAVTEPIQQADHGRSGPLVISLVKSEGIWFVRDVDLKSKDVAKAKIEAFRKTHPEAKAVAEEKK